MEQSFKDVDAFNFDDDDEESVQEENSCNNEQEIDNPNTEKTWGEHLTIKNETQPEEKPIKKSNVLNSFSQKLFSTSKLSKRNPRKSLSFSQKKSNDSIQIEELNVSSNSTEEILTNHNEDLILKETLNNKIKVVQTIETESASVNFIQHFVNDNNKQLRNNLDLGWMERVSVSAGAGSLNAVKPQMQCGSTSIEENIPVLSEASPEIVDYNSDDIIDNSEDEIDEQHVAKKCKISPKIAKTESRKENLEIRKKSPKKTRRVSSRQRKTRINLKETSHENIPEDPFNTDGSEDADYEYESPPDKNTHAKKSKNTKSKKPQDATTTTTNYELEYSVKPRIKTVPRLKSISETMKTTLNDNTTAKKTKPTTKREQEIEKFEKKLESGNLNENYVRINLKKKVFIRGKKTMNFSKFKKQQWKAKKKSLAGQDMDMGGCDGGKMLCFICGQIGHFAKYCNAHKKGDGLLPQDANLDNYTYPTLEEAAQMMKDNQLMIRKPRNDLEVDNESTDVSGSENCDSDDELLLSATIKLEQQIRNLDTQKYVDSYVTVQPFYPLNDDGSLIGTLFTILLNLLLFVLSILTPPFFIL